MKTPICSSLLVLLLAIHGSVQKSTPASLTYRAAVAELLIFDYVNNATETLNYGADKIIRYIELAAEREADIIVFGELVLTSLNLGKRHDLVIRSTLLPDPSQHYRPCINSSIPVIEPFKRIACAAAQNDIYVVVSLLEKELCSRKHCHSDGLFVYITSVVLDRTGKVIAKSRKAHLPADNDLLDVLEPLELSTFDTDFGVTFGNLICFDIMFEDTMLGLTRKLNVTDIVHSSGWESDMPFLNAIQMVAGWAYIEDVNLLSSGYNIMRFSASGSGIFGGRQGVIAAMIPLQDHEELLVADVPKKSKIPIVTRNAQHNDEPDLGLTNIVPERYVDNELCQKRQCEDLHWRYDKYDGFQTTLIAENGLTVQRLRHLDVECELHLDVSNLSPSGVTYRLLALDGVRRFGKQQVLGTRVCAIVLCANDTIDSCGHVRNTSVTFNSMNITAIHVDNARTVMMPSTLASDMMPFKNWAWDQYTRDGHVHTFMSLTTPTQNLVTFGFWGRNFEKDVRNSVSGIL